MQMDNALLFKEIEQDIFLLSPKYYLAHCIASDLRMGAGIAVPMATKFNLRTELRHHYSDLQHPTCILTGRVFNLITKKYSYEKPTYKDLEASLKKMRELVIKHGIKDIAMPRIGCGIDGLDWDIVRMMIINIFGNCNITIIACYLNPEEEECFV